MHWANNGIKRNPTGGREEARLVSPKTDLVEWRRVVCSDTYMLNQVGGGMMSINHISPMGEGELEPIH